MHDDSKTLRGLIPAPSRATLPESSSFYAIHLRGGLSRAHLERLGTELAMRQLRATPDSAPASFANARREGTAPGCILRRVFLHEGQLFLRLPLAASGGVPDASGGVPDASGDAWAEVAAVMRELRLLGHATASLFFLNAWLEQSGAFRALPTLRAALDRSFGLEGRPLAAPRLVITHGLSGSGKTTLATAAAGLLDAVLVRQDAEIVRMRRSEAVLRPGALAARLQDLAAEALGAGWAVVVESCFVERRQRQAFRALASGLHVPFTIVHCSVPPALAAQRLERRLAFGALFHGSDLDSCLVQQKLQEQLDALEPLDEWLATVLM
jgi:predicted kinase